MTKNRFLSFLMLEGLRIREIQGGGVLFPLPQRPILSTWPDRQPWQYPSEGPLVPVRRSRSNAAKRAAKRWAREFGRRVTK